MRIIAKKTDLRWGFTKGDVLEFAETGTGDIIRCINLTNPLLTKGQYALLRPHEYKLYHHRKPELVVKEVMVMKFLGIPIFKQIVKEVKQYE